jgi:hypothetical protein
MEIGTKPEGTAVDVASWLRNLGLEVWDSLHPALRLAHMLRRSGALRSILFGHWANVLTRGRLAESLHWVTQIHEAAEAYRDQDLRILTHYTAQVSYFLLGELIKAREHGDELHRRAGWPCGRCYYQSIRESH